LKIALFYANWEKFGEPWSTPLGVYHELLRRQHEITKYNLYHNDGDFLPGTNRRTYSGDCFNKFNRDYQFGYRPDALILMDYGPFDYVGCDKQYFPDIPFILEAGDCPQAFRIHAQKAGKFHGVVTPDYESAEMFSQLGIISKWMPHWADHTMFHDNYKVDQKFGVVTTCGSRNKNGEDGDKSTTDLIKDALGDDFNNERYFYGEDHPKRFCAGKIVFQCSQHSEITRRIFEGMACGKLILTDRLPDITHINDLFEENKHIVYYDDAEDAIQKAKYYLENDTEREAIASAGKSKVLSQHTVSHRVDELEDLIKEIKRDVLS
jgi:hypothetical protein